MPVLCRLSRSNGQRSPSDPLTGPATYRLVILFRACRSWMPSVLKQRGSFATRSRVLETASCLTFCVRRKCKCGSRSCSWPHTDARVASDDHGCSARTSCQWWHHTWRSLTNSADNSSSSSSFTQPAGQRCDLRALLD